MPRNWIDLAESTEGVHTVDDFKQAFYQLVTSQCLYARFRRQVQSYRLVARFQKEFKEAADLAGLTLVVKEEEGFCFVRQDATKLGPMDIQETRFLLTLRKLYHLKATEGDLTPERDAVVSIEEFELAYRDLVKREFDGDLRALLKSARSRGVAMEDREGLREGDVQPFAIAILPAIAELLSELVIDRFGASLKASLVTSQQPGSAGGENREGAI
jgi:hypothetical protein